MAYPSDLRTFFPSRVQRDVATGVLNALSDKWPQAFRHPKVFQSSSSYTNAKKDPDRPFLSDNVLLGLLKSSGLLDRVGKPKAGDVVRLLSLYQPPFPNLLGKRVEVSGLQSRPELNGQIGLATRFQSDAQRYTVELPHGRFNVQPKNLRDCEPHRTIEGSEAVVTTVAETCTVELTMTGDLEPASRVRHLVVDLEHVSVIILLCTCHSVRV